MEKTVIVIGGGAAGMMAAIGAARNGHKVQLFEKNDKLGKKLYITGKGRCNITNACDVDTFLQNVVSNPKFLYSAIYTLSNDATIDFFNALGLKTKIERGNRVFPQSDKSSDVIQVLYEEMKRLKVQIHFKQEVEEVIVKNKVFYGIKLKDKSVVKGNAVVITTGGLSYPITGSTGDGYVFAQKIGHTIKKTSPSLVPMNIKENWVKELQGLSLKNIRIKAVHEEKVIYEDFGEMLFTHFGVSGPVILSASPYLIPYVGKPLKLIIDLKPALDETTLDQRLLRDFEKYQKKQFKNTLDDLLPKKMIPIIIALSKIPEDKKIAEITKEERAKLIQVLKQLTCHINGFRGYNEAIITSGGVAVKEVDPSTMESLLAKGVYFAGEVLDLDALTGGYNLQIAWSTGFLAGISIE
jgi:hypothetical protein